VPRNKAIAIAPIARQEIRFGIIVSSAEVRVVRFTVY